MQETPIDAPLNSQESIGQRIKFLIDELKISIRKLARTLDVSDTNIRNYIERGSKPSSDVIEKILRSYPHINSLWLVTGEGTPFLSQFDGVSEPNLNYTKNNYGNNVGSNRGGTVSQYHGVGAGPDYKIQLEAAQREIVLLHSQLADKERLIQVLLNQSPK